MLDYDHNRKGARAMAMVLMKQRTEFIAAALAAANGNKDDEDYLQQKELAEKTFLQEMRKLLKKETKADASPFGELTQRLIQVKLAAAAARMRQLAASCSRRRPRRTPRLLASSPSGSYRYNQGCGSAFIFCGSLSCYFSLFGSGSSCFS